MSEGTRTVVWISHKAATCDACTIELSRGEFIAMDRAHGIRCIKCARLDGLTFLPAGVAALTRRALALSARSAVVLKFSRARRRKEYDRILAEGVEPSAARGLVRSSIERVLARWRGVAE